VRAALWGITAGRQGAGQGLGGPVVAEPGLILQGHDVSLLGSASWGARQACPIFGKKHGSGYGNTKISTINFMNTHGRTPQGLCMAELRNIDLNLLVVFQHLLEERNISAVARRLDVSQPAVSNALRRLRTVLGDELFVRTGQGMQPTPQAERLGGPLGEALALLSHTLDATHDFHPADSQRRFRIAMSDVGEIYFMPRLMEYCAQHAPGV